MARGQQRLGEGFESARLGEIRRPRADVCLRGKPGIEHGVGIGGVTRKAPSTKHQTQQGNFKFQNPKSGEIPRSKPQTNAIRGLAGKKRSRTSIAGKPIFET
jgi:hypothetical protein